jgi:hypothetical protein
MGSDAPIHHNVLLLRLSLGAPHSTFVKRGNTTMGLTHFGALKKLHLQWLPDLSPPRKKGERHYRPSSFTKK